MSAGFTDYSYQIISAIHTTDLGFSALCRTWWISPIDLENGY
jgi:hypothetical protein